MPTRRRLFLATGCVVTSLLFVACSDGDAAKEVAEAAKNVAKEATETVSEAASKTVKSAVSVTSSVEKQAPTESDAAKPAVATQAATKTETPTATQSSETAPATSATSTPASAGTAVTEAEKVPEKTEAKAEDKAAEKSAQKTAQKAPEKTVEKPAEKTPAADQPVTKKKAPALTGPHSATVAFFESMMNGKGDRAASLVAGTDAQKSAVRALSQFQKAGNGFRKRFVTEYGKDAWETFNDPEHFPEKPTSARPPFNASIPLFDSRDLEQMKLYRPRQTGDEAVYPSEQGEMRLVRVDGKWRLDASTVLPTGAEDPAPAEKMMLQRAGVIERFSKAIGMADVTPDDIDVELGRAIIEARYEMKIPEPHRFDVAHLSK